MTTEDEGSSSDAENNGHYSSYQNRYQQRTVAYTRQIPQNGLRRMANNNSMHHLALGVEDGDFTGQDIDEAELFEQDYILRASNKPFKSSSRAGLFAGGGVVAILGLPFGPIGMVIGGAVGAGVGNLAGMIVDKNRMHRKLTRAESQVRKLYYLMRWTQYNFSESDNQLHLIFKVVAEFHVMHKLASVSELARRNLKTLYSFIRRDDVQHSLWIYLDYFSKDWRDMSKSEIIVCQMVCDTLIGCCNHLQRTKPSVILRMERLTALPAVVKLFAYASQLSRKQQLQSYKKMEALMFAENNTTVKRASLGGAGVVEQQGCGQTTTTASVTRNATNTVTWNGFAGRTRCWYPSGHHQPHRATDDTDERVLLEQQKSLEEFRTRIVISHADGRIVHFGESNNGDDGDNTNLELLVPADASTTYEKDMSSNNSPRRTSLVTAVICDNRATSPVITEVAEPAGAIAEASSADPCLVLDRSKRPRILARDASSRKRLMLFKSLSDLINFDESLKHEMPIEEYELKYVEIEEKQAIESPPWECCVNRKDTKVYKLRSEESPVVLVKAFTNFHGIPPDVVAFHIRDIDARAAWDTNFSNFRCIEKDVDNNEIIYSTIKAPFPIAHRDFVQWRKTSLNLETGTIIIMMRSAVHSKAPLMKGVVRAETQISGYIIRRLDQDPNSTHLFIIAQTDIKGLIPKAIVNAAVSRAPASWTDNLRRVCEKYMREHGSTTPQLTAPIVQVAYEEAFI